MPRPSKPAYDLRARCRACVPRRASWSPEDRWSGGCIFENEWQSFRARRNRKLEPMSAEHLYQAPGRYTVAVKVIDIR